MHRLLFITDTYYPDSGATTTIVKRTAEALVDRGYQVDVYPSEISGQHFGYDDECSGVRIVRNFEVSDYDVVFSCAVNFRVNFLAHEAIKQLIHKPLTINHKPVKWLPMSYDPYAFDPHITAEQKEEYYRQEMDALKDATRIFFLNEFRKDYAGSPVEDKIIWFNLPCIKTPPVPLRKVIEHPIAFSTSYINCLFLGDFYYGVENTDFIFRLFNKMPANIRIYTVGNPGDYQDTIDLWKKRLGDRYVCHKRICQAEAQSVMMDCDVLVSMGHDSANMCPSKVIDFVSSGKPILHIQKIQDCCARKYLERCPNKYCIYQGEELNKEKLNEVERFLVNAKDMAKIPFSTVLDLYNDFTMDALIGKIIAVLND